MKNPYISYEVKWDKISYKEGDIFTYKKFDTNNNIVTEEMPLFDNGQINFLAFQIVEKIKDNKKYIEQLKEEKNSNIQKNNTIEKLEIKSKLMNISPNINGNELNIFLKNISDEYNISLNEIEKIHQELIAEEIEKNSLLEYAKKSEQAKLEKPEINIKLTSEEFNIVDDFINKDMSGLERNTLRKSVEAIQEKYNISFKQLRTIYKIERYTQQEKNRLQNEVSSKQAVVSKIEQNKDKAMKIIADFPNNLSNAETTQRMEKIEEELGINKEDLFELYQLATASKSVAPVIEKNEQETLPDKVYAITDEEKEFIAKYLTKRPCSLLLAEQIEEIKNKYNLTGRDIVLIYYEQREQSKKVSKHFNIKGQKAKIDRTARKLEYLIQEINDKNLNEQEKKNELDKLSKEYNINQSQIELLTTNAMYNKRKNDLSNQLSKKLSGQKIPKKKTTKEKSVVDKIMDIRRDKQKLIDIGKDLVIESKIEDWEEMIELDYSDIVPITTAIEIMKILNNGGGIGKARKELEKSHNFHINKKKIIELVSNYSPYGQEFARKTKKYIMSKPERLVKFVLEKKTSLKSNVEEEFDAEVAIKELENLKKYIVEPEDLGIDNVIEPPSPWKVM